MALTHPAATDLSTWLDAADEPSEGSVSRLRLLIPHLRDAQMALLLQDMISVSGGQVVATVPGDEHDSLLAAFFDLGVEFDDVATTQYRPPWFMQADKVAHLTAPLPFRQAREPHRITLYICDHVADGAFGPHNAGAFERGAASRRRRRRRRRSYEQRSPLALCPTRPLPSDAAVLDMEMARTPPKGGRRAAHAEKLVSLLAPGARVLLRCSEHRPELDGAGRDPLWSLSAAEVQGLFRGAAVHHITAPNVPLFGGGDRRQQAVHSLIVATKDGRGAYFRPPACPCCR